MSINPPHNVIISNLVTPLRKNAAQLFNPASQRPTSILAQFDWEVDYAVSVTNPSANVFINMSGGGVIAPIDIIRSVKIDNTGNPFPVYVYFPDTTDMIVAPPNTVVWEPVVTNAKQANVFLIDGTNDVGLTKVYFCNFFVPPYINAEIAQAIDLQLATPQILFGGLILAAGNVAASGQSYVNGLLAVSGGGGGTGAAAHGVLDAFGRFTGVVIDNAGANYKSAITLTATASNAARPNWNGSGGTNYNPGDIVSASGTEWQRNGAFIFGQGSAPAYVVQGYAAGSQVSRGGHNYTASATVTQQVPPAAPWVNTDPPAPPSDSGWTNSGGAGGRTAVFTVTMGAVGGEIINNATFAAPALGDQFIDYPLLSSVAPGVVLQDNLWGSPYTSGFIYIKAMEITFLFSSVPGNFNVAVGEPGGIIFRNLQFFTQAAASAQDGMISALVSYHTLTRLSGMNVKLDATKEWRLVYLSGTGQLNIAASFCYTYSLR